MPAPTRLGKYEIRRELGKGAMGIVYEAFDPVIERRVAIKVIRQDEFTATQADDLMARLKREAQAAGRLNHPGIVSIYDFGEDATLGGAGVAFIAMELIEGRELKQLYEEGRRFTPAEAARIVGAVLTALQHAHDRGVTHRDIKPANVILLADGSVKVADFGVARIESSDLTQAGTIIGTPQYMSPEQLLGLTVDGRSDLFSCGVLLYELLTGEKPFTGSVTTVIQKVLNEEPSPPSRRNPALGAAWDAVVAKAMAKKPEQRFASAAAMAEAVRAAAARHDADATVISVQREGAAAGAPMANGTTSPARPGRAGRIGAVALGLAAVGAAALFFWPDQRQAPPRAIATPPAASAVLAAASAVGPASPAGTGEPPASTVAAAPSPPTPSPPAPSAPAASAPGTAVIAKAAPAPASAPVRAKPAASPSAPAPAAPPSGNDWPRRTARLQALKGPLTLSSAFGTLLDPLSEFERGTLGDFEAALKRRPGRVAMALGARQGRIVYWTATQPDAQAAADMARTECEKNHGTPCRLLLADGELKRETLIDVARQLGALPADQVRPLLLRGFAESTARFRNAEAAAARAAAASAPAPGADWPQRLARLQAAKAPLTLGSALTALLEPLGDAERRTLADFEAAQKRRPPKVAIAMGTKDGHLAYWTWNDAQLATAVDTARRECEKNHAISCRLVYADGELRREAFIAVARGLGSRPVEQVRASLLRAFGESVARYRQAEAAGAAPAAPSSAAAAPPATAERTRPAWTASIERLKAAPSDTTLASALALLLNVEGASEHEQLAKLETHAKKLRYSSAVAMGEANGALIFRVAQDQRRTAWAEEQAVARCNEASHSPCVLVMSDGQYRAAGLPELAPRLARHGQIAVRQRFLRSLQKLLP